MMGEEYVTSQVTNEWVSKPRSVGSEARLDLVEVRGGRRALEDVNLSSKERLVDRVLRNAVDPVVAANGDEVRSNV